MDKFEKYEIELSNFQTIFKEEIAKTGKISDKSMKEYYEFISFTSLLVKLGKTSFISHDDQHPSSLDFDFYLTIIKNPEIVEILFDERWGNALINLEELIENGIKYPALRVRWENKIEFLASSNDKKEFNKKIDGYISALTIFLGSESIAWIIELV